MDFDMQILPECFIDTTLAETLSFPKRGYKHIKGCNKVLFEMKKNLITLYLESLMMISAFRRCLNHLNY